MSLATRQTNLKLHLIKGLLGTIEANDMLTEGTRATAYYAHDLADMIVRKPVRDGSDKDKDDAWIAAKLIEWGKLVDRKGIKIHLETLIAMALHLSEDLCARIMNIDTLHDIKDLRISLVALSDEMGGDKIPLLEEADDLLKEMDSLIGFVR